MDFSHHGRTPSPIFAAPSARWCVRPGSRSRRFCRSRSASAPTPRSSASPAHSCCARCPTATRIGWSSSGTDRLASASRRTGSRRRSTSTSYARTAGSNRRDCDRRELESDGDGEPERIGALRVSSNLLPMLGVRAELGKLFAPEDDRPGQVGQSRCSRTARGCAATAAIVLSLGRVLTLNGQPYEVIGCPAVGLRPASRSDADARRRRACGRHPAVVSRCRCPARAERRRLQPARQVETGRVGRHRTGRDGCADGASSPRAS